ncbi:DUF6236 family protein [Stenotrophomonas sp. 1337]|uniref:DUF6236 family protein n=1 Tax=Stenotrophomonas sp. 1337 TaxID=2817757 RepID=UPI0028636ED8|nr:DUF6236 family protein [Stenotrophomonas sp. 1337]MDR6694025.1 hypothetical protein [Stenotrophomonas sp. 1337]
MRANALFFPHISLPNDAWTAKSLLYWDRMSAIVPREQLRRPEQMTPFMRDLLTDGLVVPIAPGRYMHHVPRFDESFIAMVEERLRRSSWLRSKVRHRRWMNADKVSLIHAEKLGDIPRFLVQEGLAEAASWNWFRVESATANLFMAYLAACLGAIPEVDAAPVTNKMAFARCFQPDLGPTRFNTADGQSVRNHVLHSLLPVPSGPVGIAKLVKFKQQHGDLLQRFRALVEVECTRVARLPAEDRADANAAFLQKCEQDIAEIKEAMRPSFGKVVLGGLVPVLGAGLGAYIAPPTAVASYAATSLTLAGAVYTALTSMQGPLSVRNRPLAYVAHAQRLFGGG